MRKQTYFQIQSVYLNFRSPQVKQLLNFLKKHINLSSDTVISLGCGVAAEFQHLTHKNKIGIDQDPSMIDFCKSTHKHSTFICANHILYADKLKKDGGRDLCYKIRCGCCEVKGKDSHPG